MPEKLGPKIPTERSPKKGKNATTDFTIKTSKSFAEVHRRIVAGKSLISIARYMHEQGDCLDDDERTLQAKLSVYRRRLSSTEILMAREPSFVQKAKEDLGAAIDEVEELAFIYNIQKDRILQGRDKEKKVGLLTKTLGNEVRIAGELLRTSASIKEQVLSSSVGNNVVPLAQADRRDLRSVYGERVAKSIQDPNTRNRVINTVQSIIDAATAKVEGETYGQSVERTFNEKQEEIKKRAHVAEQYKGK